MPTHPFQKSALRFIRQHDLVRRGDDVLAGVSGGPDSVALLDVLFQLAPDLGLATISVLHFNHQLRGKDSDADEAFVQELAAWYKMPFFSGKEDVAAAARARKVSLEMAARDSRHRFFADMLLRLNAQKLALAHTTTDQAEEVLLRLLRGTGPSGLAGMPPKGSSGIIRPLLFSSRQEVLDYLSDRKLSFREDASNLEPFCQRNAVRLKVFPVLDEVFHPRTAETISRCADLVREEEDYWTAQVQALWNSVCGHVSPSAIVLQVSALEALHPALRRRMLRVAVERVKGNLLGIFAVHIDALMRLVRGNAPRKAADLPDGLIGMREGESLILARERPLQARKEEEGGSEAVIEHPGLLLFPSFQLRLRLGYRLDVSDAELSAGRPDRALLDAEKLVWPLVVRSWKPGDRFKPLGLCGTKKLQDFFTDAKIPQGLRGRVPLLCDGEKICWVMGYRLDDRVKVTPATRRILVATQEPFFSPSSPERSGAPSERP